jgi:AraC-like DNA-binding protein
MASISPKPIILSQNRLLDYLDSSSLRRGLYRAVLERRAAESGAGKFLLRVPDSRGLRLRLPGKPFHSTPELFFQEGGRTRFLLPHQSFEVGPRGAALIPAGMPHGEQWSGAFFLNIIVMFQPESFSLHVGCLPNRKGPIRCSPVDRFAYPGRFAMIRYLEEIVQETGTGPAAKRLRAGLQAALLSRLLQALDPAGSPAVAPKKEDLLLRRSREMIDVYFSRMDFSVIWLARELGCSADHLSRRFRARTGRRLIEAVHRRRIDHAMQILRESDMSVAEAAWACGFSRPSHFNRVFKALTGTTPKMFRHGSGRTSRGINPDGFLP